MTFRGYAYALLGSGHRLYRVRYSNRWTDGGDFGSSFRHEVTIKLNNVKCNNVVAFN